MNEVLLVKKENEYGEEEAKKYADGFEGEQFGITKGFDDFNT